MALLVPDLFAFLEADRSREPGTVVRAAWRCFRELRPPGAPPLAARILEAGEAGLECSGLAAGLDWSGVLRKLSVFGNPETL